MDDGKWVGVEHRRFLHSSWCFEGTLPLVEEGRRNGHQFCSTAILPKEKRSARTIRSQNINMAPTKGTDETASQNINMAPEQQQHRRNRSQNINVAPKHPSAAPTKGTDETAPKTSTWHRRNSSQNINMAPTKQHRRNSTDETAPTKQHRRNSTRLLLLTQAELLHLPLQTLKGNLQPGSDGF